MRHEPRALVRYAQHPVKLVSAHALLAGTKQVKRKEPLVQRNVAVFHDRSNGDGELLTARCASWRSPRRGCFAALLGGKYRVKEGSRETGVVRGANTTAVNFR